jgi:hypothetical protein
MGRINRIAGPGDTPGSAACGKPVYYAVFEIVVERIEPQTQKPAFRDP